MSFHQVPTKESINYIKSASTADLIVIYKRLKIRFTKINEHLWFNSACKKHKVVPKYIENNTKCNIGKSYCRNLMESIKYKWINNELKWWYAQRDNVSSHIKVTHIELHRRLCNIELDILFDKIWEITKELSAKIHANHMKKFYSLKKDNHPKSQHFEQNNSRSFYKRIHNSTDVSFNSEELHLLEKGPKYCPVFQNTVKDLENLAVDVDICTNDITIKYAAARQIQKEIEMKPKSYSSKISNSEWTALKNIKTKIQEHNLVFTKADKGNTLVVTTKVEYNNKVKEFLNSGPFTILKQDPTNKFNDVVKNTLTSTNSIFNKADIYKYRIMNPKIPRLHGYYKLHKEGVPIRPVVSYTNAPTYRLASEANRIFKDFTKFVPQYSIKNTLELIDKIKDLWVPNEGTLISFDVKNLFPSVPIKDCMEAMYEIMTKSKLEPQQIVDLNHIFEVCLSQNYFIYEGKPYKQLDGLAMGSPLSPLCADVFMDKIEKLILGYDCFRKYILYWYRYVDDILCLWTGPMELVNDFLNFINTIHTNITFTMELGHKQINFLDLSIMISNNRHQFKIFRKDTYSDNIIPMESHHPNSHKHAALHSMIHRLISVPMSEEDFYEELVIIKNIAENNGYSRRLIDTLLKNKQKKNITSLLYSGGNKINTKEEKKYVRLPFLGRISYKVARELKGKVPVYYTSRSLKKILFNSCDKIPTTAKSGVYKLRCGECDGVYVGQTGRSFSTRVKEHARSWRLKKGDSAFAKHLIDTGHCFDPTQNFEALHICPKGKKLNALEALEINKLRNKHSLLNDQTDLTNSPLLNKL